MSKYSKANEDVEVREPLLVGTTSQTTEPTPPPQYTPFVMSATTATHPHPQPGVMYLVHSRDACPRGGEHIIRTKFGFLGWCCAICFFPEGILCCLCLGREQCIKCKEYFN